MYVPDNLNTKDDQEKFLRAMAEITNNGCIKSFNLQDIFCTGEAISETENLNGQTAFFRHFLVIRYLVNLLKEEVNDNQTIRVLSAPSSIGCEAYGLTGLALSYGFNNIAVDGFDRSEMFTKVAKLGSYPSIFARRLENWCDIAFDGFDPNIPIVPVKDEIKERVSFLPPSKFEDLKTDNPYDVVMANNLFQYLDEASLRKTADKIKNLSPSFVIHTKVGCDDFGALLGSSYGSLESHPYYKKETDEMGVFAEGASVLKDYGFWFRHP